MNTERKKLYKATELAEIFGVSPKTIYKAAKAGKIPSYRIGRCVRFEMPDIENLKDIG